MKNQTLLKKSISLLISLSMLSACSNSNHDSQSSGGSGNTPIDAAAKTKADQLYVQWLEKVTKGEISLLAAESLLPALKQRIKESGEPLTAFDSSLEDLDLNLFKRQIIKKQNAAIEKMLMSGTNVFSNHVDEMHLTLPFQSQGGSYAVMGVDRLVDLGTLQEESKRRLEAVFKVYDDAAKEAAEAEAAKRIADARIETEIVGLDGLAGEQKAIQIKKFISEKKLDQTASTGKDEIDLIVKKYLFDALYDLLMNHSNLKGGIQSAVIAAETYERLVKTAQAFASFRDSVQNTWSDIRNAQNELSAGLQQIRGRISQYDVEELIHDPAALDDWKNAIAEGKDLIEGQVDPENPAFPQKAVSEAYQKVKASSQKLAKNTRALADSGQMLVNAGRLFLDEETVRKAQSVVDDVNKVSLIMDKLSSGGVVGVVSAVGIAMGGVGSGMDIAGARHAELSGKLDAILKNQKIMIDLQVETIQLQKKTLQAIEDMAQMIDNNHRITMARLDGVDAQLATLTELLSVENLADFYTCDRLIYGRAVEDQSFRLTFLESGVRDALQNFTSLGALIAKADQTEDYKRCRRGSQDLFLNEGRMSVVMSYGASINSSDVSDSMSGLINEGMVRLNPLRSLFKQKFQKGLGDPLAKYRALHLPAKYMSLVPMMDQIYASQAANVDETLDGPAYFLANRSLNPNMVLNQVRALLEVTKLTSVLGEGGWTSQQPINVADTNKVQKEIQNALNLVQSAIAQESLLAGEPVLSLLYDRVNSLLANPASAEATLEFKTQGCVGKEDFDRIGCLLSKNPVLKRNFVQYFLHRRYGGGSSLLGAAGQVSYQALYQEAQNYKNGVASIVNLQQLGNVSYSKTSQGPALQIGETELPLPTVGDYQADLIEYSVVMKDLLLLQRDLVQVRLKLEGADFTAQERQILAEFLFQSFN